jgi:NADPH-dependent ferric siderophore reductase
MTVTATTLPMVLAEVEVASTERISPTFVRLELAAPELADVGLGSDEDRWWDQRFKLIVPHADGGITSVRDADESWLSTWLDRPVAERGHMRTYTLRALRGEGAARRLVVDIAVHDGDSGPGADWAGSARVGDRAVVLLPRRGHFFGGIEFAPPARSRLLLAGDETAVPAICAVLEQLGPEAVGAAYLEVPHPGDIQDVRGPEGVEVTWLVRGDAELGAPLAAAVTRHLNGTEVAVEAPAEVDPDLWETPTYSSSGEEIPTVDSADDSVDVSAGQAAVGQSGAEQSGAELDDELYAWIAGESGVVTGLRRFLVKECGIDRRRVAFMGYWRRGVAMKS